MDNQRSLIELLKGCRLAHLANNSSNTPKSRRQIGCLRALVCSALLALLPGAPVQAGEQPILASSSSEAAAGSAIAPGAPDAPEGTSAARLGGLSDAQLTNLAADWEKLDSSARSELIAETRERMLPGQNSRPSTPDAGAPANDSGRDSRPVLPERPRSQQREGVAQNSGQSQVQVQSQGRGQIRVQAQRRRYGRVVRQADGSLVRIETQVVTVRRRDPQRAFGVGFERRHRTVQGSAAAQQSVTTSVSARVTDAGRAAQANARPLPKSKLESKAQPSGQITSPRVIAVTETPD